MKTPLKGSRRSRYSRKRRLCKRPTPKSMNVLYNPAQILLLVEIIDYLFYMSVVFFVHFFIHTIVHFSLVIIFVHFSLDLILFPAYTAHIVYSVLAVPILFVHRSSHVIVHRSLRSAPSQIFFVHRCSHARYQSFFVHKSSVGTDL